VKPSPHHTLVICLPCAVTLDSYTSMGNCVTTAVGVAIDLAVTPLNKGRVVTSMLTLLAVSFISSYAFAQSDSDPKSDAPPAAPTAACSVRPDQVIVGEPVTVTVTTSNFNPKHRLTYVWYPSNGGGKVIGNDTTAQIETTNAAPSSYAVTANVTDAEEKENNVASCSASFTINPPPPRNLPTLSIEPLPPRNLPTMSILASAMSVPVGATVNLSGSCTSPDGVPASVAGWTASGGTVSGSGDSAALNTAGVAPGAIAVSVTCTDSRGLSAQASTEIIVEKPPLAPPNAKIEVPAEIEVMESRLALDSIYFPTSMPPIENPDAGLVASQQQTLVTLATDFKKYLESRPEAHLLLVGHTDPRGHTKYDQKLSERRVGRVKSFLVEQGISEANIDVEGFGARHALTEAAVKDAIENNPQLSPEERQRALANILTIVLASDRRVDITLSTTGQSSVRRFPFNAVDALTLIGGREGEAKKEIAKPAPKYLTNNR
jgi:outer membrane protein OmpA-like peptidoglycan-associated protein